MSTPRLEFSSMTAALKFLRVRLTRGFSLASLGANESRIAFDLLAAFGALALAVAFEVTFVSPEALRSYYPLLVLPVAFVLLNLGFGIYTTKKTAPGRVKALLLFLSVLGISIPALLFHRASAVVLWALLIIGPVTLTRLLLGLPFSKHEDLKALVFDRHGPVLVIGGAGYIGSHTVDLLLKQGKKVRVLDRLMYGSEPLQDFLGNPNFELVEGDCTEITKLTFAMRDASAVIHLAGLVGDPACALDHELTRHTNIIATRMAKDVAQSLGVHRFIFASSCSVYGVSDKEVNELDELNPVSLYAQTKIDSERELLFSAGDDFFVTVLRFATVFGHSRRPRFDLVGNLFTAQAMINGLITVVGPDQWRPFVHVRDLGRAIVAVLNAPASVVQSQTFNVGDKRLNLTILQLAEAVKAVTSKYRDVQISIASDEGDRRNYAVSFEKIRTMLGFECSTLMEAGIQEMVNYFQAGKYDDYRSPKYSNVATTRQLLEDFYDPASTAKLYAPLTLSSQARA
jgi:nucleoside-diphosphate-sugar epimerase